MTDCERLRADAPGLVALPPGDPERAAASAHARGCEGCARALHEAERLQAVLGSLEPGPLPAGALARAAAAIEEELEREQRRRSVWAAGAAAALGAALAGLARHREGRAIDWAIAAALGVAAVALAALASRRPRLVIGGAIAAVLAAASAARAGPLAAAAGVECLATELLGAAAIVWVGWLALRRSGTRPARAAVTAAAAAGALAGAAALQLTCGAHGSAPHFLAFHAGGVILALAVAAATWRPWRVAVA